MPSIVPLVKIKLDKVRHLRLDLNAMFAYKRATGKSINVLSPENWEEDMLYLLWACLLHEDKELTVEDVGAMVYIGNLTEVSEAITIVCGVSQAEGDPKNSPRSDGS